KKETKPQRKQSKNNEPSLIDSIKSFFGTLFGANEKKEPTKKNNRQGQRKNSTRGPRAEGQKNRPTRKPRPAKTERP
ncbi:hypothetical protein, partial [Vibrio cholerae]|uniref:hypothetical protein n=1 Tax=Vibrio cholerae TaxID=666 RepID=UPI001C11129B